MDYEKLIEQLKNLEACAYGYHINGEVLGMDCSDFEQVMVDAATALSTLQAENASLRKERDAAVEDVLDAAITPCSYCKHGPINGGICDMDNDNHEMFSCWEWRGPEEG